MNMLRQMTLAILSSQSILACRTKSEVQTIAADVYDTFIKDKPLDDETMLEFIGGVIRLSFHDAGTLDPTKSPLGGPTGCFPDEDPNKGLDKVVKLIDPTFQKHKHICTQADFWYLVTAVAIDGAIDNANSLSSSSPSSSSPPDISSGRMLKKKKSKKSKKKKTAVETFKWGRVTEDVCEYKKGRLPQHQKGQDMLIRVFKERMDFTLEEIVTLLGAHSVGTMHTANSGFHQGWDESGTSLDIKYFGNLATKEFLATNNTINEFAVYQSTVNASEAMLAPEIALYYEFEPDNAPLNPNATVAHCNIGFNEADCDALPKGIKDKLLKNAIPLLDGKQNDQQCKMKPVDDIFRKTVDLYANDQEQFQDDFIAVIGKMSELGYGKQYGLLRDTLIEPCDDDKNLHKCCVNDRCASYTYRLRRM